MVRLAWFGFSVALAAALEGCGRKPPEVQAASAARDLLTAVWSGDNQAFEAHVDRAAVREDLRRQLALLAQSNALSVEGGASDAALDRMITPAAFRIVDALGGNPTAAPSEPQVIPLMTPLGEDRACLHATDRRDACLLTFGRGADGWKLVGMAPAGFTIALPPEPVKEK
jgi:hypothetical protein